MFVFTPYLVPLGAGRAVAECAGVSPVLPGPPWSPFSPLPQARLKFPSAEVAVCLIAEVT